MFKDIRMKASELIKLSKTALNLFDEYLKEKNFKPQTRIFVHHFTTDLKIDETGIQSSGSSEIIQKPDWTTGIYDFINTKIKTLDEFKQIAQKIAVKYKDNINKLAPGSNEISQSSLWLENFIRKLIQDKLDDELSEDSIIDYVSLFKSELELFPSEYRYTYHLSGIYIEPDSIKINNKVCIRRTQKSDLEYTKELLMDIPVSRRIPSSILEIKLSVNEEKESFEYINKIFESLRLYKLGAIYSLESKTQKKTIIWPSTKSIGWSNGFYFGFRKYTVKESEIDIFIKFINIFESRLSFDKAKKEFWSLGITIDRYNDALLEKTDIDRKLTTAVMGLESLFSLPKEKGENAYKLSVRVSKLLGYLNFESDKTKTFIEKAYKFRNMVVHGSYIQPKERKEMNKIFPEILSYLRISIIVFLLSHNIKKNDMIIKIDKSLVSSSYSENLKKIVENNIEGFEELLMNL